MSYSEEYFKHIVENISGIVGILNHDLTVRYANPATEKVLGYKFSNFHSKSIFEFVHPQDITMVASNASKLLLAPGMTTVITARLKHADGSWKLMEITVKNLIEADPIAGIVFSFRDIDDRRNVEEIISKSQEELKKARDEANEANRKKSEFLANMSHEIRTPMASIIGMVELMLGGNLSPEHRELSTIIRDSANMLLNIINEVLDISKIEAGKMTIEKAEFDIISLIENTVGMVAIKAVDKQLGLKTEIDGKLDRFVFGDSLRIGQILMNFLSNSIKFTESGEISVRAFPVGGQSDKVTVRIEVADTGVGLRPEDCERIFQPFTQIDSSAMKKYGGTGLGLPISKRLAELMDGKIGVELSPSVGSKFWVEIPLVKLGEKKPARTSNIPTPPQEASQTVVPDPKRKERTILVVEDNHFNQKLVSMQLARMGFNVRMVDSGKDAVKAAADGGIDLILMDCQMPVMDGYQATRLIREAESGKNFRVPIVALTADAMKGSRDNCISSGMNDYIIKPVNIDTLEQVIGKWLSSGQKNARQVSAAVPDAADQVPVIDREVFKELKKLQMPGFPDVVAELIKIFICDTPPKIKALEAAVGERNSVAVQKMAHNLKSSCANIGALRLSALCRTLENDARAGELTGAERARDNIVSEYARVETELNKIIDAGGAK